MEPCLNLARASPDARCAIMVCVCINAPCAMLELDSMFVLFVIMNVTTTFFVHTFYAELTIWLSGGDQGWVILFGSYPSVCFAPTRRGCVCLVC